eukprot:473657-Amphidinium_carterae.2
MFHVPWVMSSLDQFLSWTDSTNRIFRRRECQFTQVPVLGQLHKQRRSALGNVNFDNIHFVATTQSWNKHPDMAWCAPCEGGHLLQQLSQKITTCNLNIC